MRYLKTKQKQQCGLAYFDNSTFTPYFHIAYCKNNFTFLFALFMFILILTDSFPKDTHRLYIQINKIIDTQSELHNAST